MVAVFNKEQYKELLISYLITRKFKDTVEAGLSKSQSNSPTPRPPLLLTQGEPPPPQPRLDSEWVISIRGKLDKAHEAESACPWAELSIYRVPKSLREGDDKAYIPQTVSLGPYHNGQRHLRDMEPHKWRALHRVLKRTGHNIDLYLDSIVPLEEEARSCYEGNIGLTSNEFVEMMVLDGTFILELFRGAAGEGFKKLGYSHNDPVFAMRSTMHSVQRDMIMLENQIPLFILDRLLALQLGKPEHSGLVAKLVVQFFDPLIPTDEPLVQTHRSKMQSSSYAAFDPLSNSGLHCLDVFRESLLRTDGPQPSRKIWIKNWSLNRRGAVDKRRQQLIHCVSELREAGVKFRKRRTDRFWDIKFENGVLKIPRLLIHEGTKSLFLNIIAFEQCHLDCNNDITSYVIFMDNLINSEEDVGYLHYHGIIEHWLGNDGEVTNLFNRLCQEVVFDVNDSYLLGLSEKMNRYYNNRWNSWQASLKHNYFGNPWAIASLVAAVVLLLLTLVQTFYSFYSYYWPSS